MIIRVYEQANKVKLPDISVVIKKSAIEKLDIDVYSIRFVDIISFKKPCFGTEDLYVYGPYFDFEN